MGAKSSKTPPALGTPWAQISENKAVAKIYVYPKGQGQNKTLYGISTDDSKVLKKPVESGAWTDTGDADAWFLVVAGAQMYTIGKDLKDIKSAHSSGSGTWETTSIGFPLYGLAMLNNTLYTFIGGVLHSAPASGGPLTQVPGVQEDKVLLHLTATGGNLYGSDGKYIYVLTSPTSGPWVQMTSALPSGVTSISSMCSNSTRIFVVGSDSYVYGTC